MGTKVMTTVDANEATTSVAHRVSECVAIYPITPSSPMGELADEWSSKGKTNIWGTVPQVVEMQSEAGAAGAVHGALQGGALTTTFTASQGLLLMIPNMYKIAGELTSCCIHVSARTLATHALSIFGDHSDVMACRQTGWAMTASGSVQEAHDMALISHAATLKTRVPFMHFFDGFRTSHEVSKMEVLSDDDIRHMMDDDAIKAHRERALTPDRPLLRGTAQNPDTFFQAREACNTFYDKCPDIVQDVMDQFAAKVGRAYKLFDYVGAPDAERVIIIMGSGAETVEDTVNHLVAKGEKIGVIKVRLYRPFSAKAFVGALPDSVKTIGVLDRTKEPGSVGDPLYLDVIAAIRQTREAAGLEGVGPIVVAGRYGLSSKEFTPAMVKGVYDELAKADAKKQFTVGIVDDVTGLSIDYDDSFDIEHDDAVRALFFGLGADGTVGANKNSIKIIGEETDNYAQGYFVYDSKKSGAMTTSHLRFGPREIRAPYLITKANFIACHQFVFLEKYDMLKFAQQGATFLLNSPFEADEVWAHLPKEVQQDIIDKELKVYSIDGNKVAESTGMGGRVNTIMQTCFFAISGVLPKDEAIAKIKQAIKKTYGKKGEEIVNRNFAAVDAALAHMNEVKIPATATATKCRVSMVPAEAPDFVQRVTGVMMAGDGDILPVSAFPVDGTYDTATTQWEKRNIALEVPIWDGDVCIQCNKCAMVCPHASIRSKIYDPADLEKAPADFRSVDYKGKDFPGKKFTIQVAAEDCTGCKLCVNVCPAKDKSNPKHKAINMVDQPSVRERERENYSFFLSLPEADRTAFDKMNVKSSQFLLPLFEYSGACTGCGETAYVKLMSQLFGDRLLIGNATGCSSIYGGNLPTTPYCTDANGRGPAWANSLFEDNAEFTFGLRFAVDKHTEQARELVQKVAGDIGDNLVTGLLNADQTTELGLKQQRERVVELKTKLASVKSDDATRLLILADYLVKKSVWALGGDGWAYDIGYGGLDHVVSMDRDINILCMDTEVYSNTGGQASKATPIGAAAKFAAAGKSIGKKDLGLMAMSYGHVYVASIAMGAKDQHTVNAFIEAESYPGPSLIIAYSHCIAHGYDLSFGLEQQKKAVGSGLWPLYRYDPRRTAMGEAPLILDSTPGKVSVQEYMQNETRFRMVQKMNPERFAQLSEMAVEASKRRVAVYDHMAKMSVPGNGNGDD